MDQLSGSEVEAQARQVGYGALVSPKAVQMLVDAIVKYQQDTITDVAKLRIESEKSAKEIAGIVEGGKQLVLKAITNFQAAGQLPPPSQQPPSAA